MSSFISIHQFSLYLCLQTRLFVPPIFVTRVFRVVPGPGLECVHIFSDMPHTHTHTHTHICGLFISDQWGENEPKVCSHPNLTLTRGKFLLGSQRAKTYMSPLDSQMYGISFPPILDAISASFQHSTRVGWPTDLVCLHWRWYLGHKTFIFEVEMSRKKKKKRDKLVTLY